MKIRGILMAAGFALCSLLATGRAQAQWIMLEIPGVPGEAVTPANFVNQIEVLALSWGASSYCGGTNNVQDLSFTKFTDKASIPLLTALKDHTVYPTATFRFVRSDTQVYQSYQLTNALVSSVSLGGSAGEPRTTESVTLTFSQVLATYTYFDSGGKQGSSTNTTIVSGACP